MKQLVKNRCGDWHGLFQNVNIIKDKKEKEAVRDGSNLDKKETIKIHGDQLPICGP